MSKVRSYLVSQIETTCGTLLHELKIIWDEVGESEDERDKMLQEIEEECLDVYRRRVDQANKNRALIRRTIADSEAELANICSAMREKPVHIRKQNIGPKSLKDELSAILCQLEEMRKKKYDRINQFTEVLEVIQKISNEMHNFSDRTTSNIIVDETDLSSRKLEEYQRELEKLQKEKSERLMHLLNLLNSLNSLCSVLGIDFTQTIVEVHPSLDDDYKDISNITIEKLRSTIERLRDVKLRRMQRLQDLATSMLELWHLMDTPIEEQQMYQNVTCNIAASEHEITEANMLSDDFINSVEAEVSRLEELKTSKLKELVSRKRSELDEICRRTHLIPESNDALEIAIGAVETGAVDSASVLEEIEGQIGKAKEEAFSRIEVLERVEKWLTACEEETWLEEYSMDENRYNTGRGTHKNLKRAEKARVLVSKIPGMVEALATKTRSWENERGYEFIYDGSRLLSMLEDYTILRQQRELERKRQRDQKKLQGQLVVEKEVLFGSKPSSPMKLPNSPMKIQSVKKASKLPTRGDSVKKNSEGTTIQSPRADTLQIGKASSTPTRLAKRSDYSNGNAREFVESPMKRKPFVPVSSPEPSEPDDSTNFSEEDNLQSDIISSSEEESVNSEVVEINLLSSPQRVTSHKRTVSSEIEISFEERRFGFVSPKACLEKKI